MKEKTYMFDLMDTLVWSPNLMKLFASENAELLANFKQNPKQYQKEAAQVADSYLADGRVEIRLYDETLNCLRNLKQKGKIAILSNGTKDSVRRIMSSVGIDSIIDEALSLDNFGGKDKSDSELYPLVTDYLADKGLYVATYSDDKDKYCLAAANSVVIPRVFQVSRSTPLAESKGKYTVIKSLEEVL